MVPTPQGLNPLLKTSFFAQCNTHHTHKSNMYCLDCTGDALCCLCCSEHDGHKLVQIRRLSYHNVVGASEISNFFNISVVQTYMINDAKFVFLNERPASGPGKRVSQYLCKICQRGLMNSFCFCSLGCKSTIVPKQEMVPTPQGLNPLLKTSFFAQCNTHHTHKSNMYCLDCTGDALCCLCCSEHDGHKLVQIRRLSYHNVVGASEISNFFNISGVQTYMINDAKFVFLNERPASGPGKRVSQYLCKICQRGLMNSFCFCSLGCKLRSMKRDDSEPVLRTDLESEESSLQSKRLKISELNRANCSDSTMPLIRRGRKDFVPRRSPDS